MPEDDKIGNPAKFQFILEDFEFVTIPKVKPEPSE